MKLVHAFAALLAVAPSLARAQRAIDVTVMHDDAPVRAQFERDAGHVRLLLLLSPTCGFCLRGGATIDDELLKKLSDPSLRAYYVWVPVMKGDDEPAARRAAQRFGDRRVRQFWDADGRLAAAFGQLLQIPASDGPAWDVYLVYDGQRRWRVGSLPAPTLWMHQLRGVTRAPFLDGAALRARVQALLSER